MQHVGRNNFAGEHSDDSVYSRRPCLDDAAERRQESISASPGSEVTLIFTTDENTFAEEPSTQDGRSPKGPRVQGEVTWIVAIGKPL
jgi:hypothetical protein